MIKKVLIRNQDIQNILEVSERQATNVISKVKKHYSMEKHQPLTISKFQEFYGFTWEEIKDHF